MSMTTFNKNKWTYKIKRTNYREREKKVFPTRVGKPKMTGIKTMYIKFVFSHWIYQPMKSEKIRFQN